uniref:NPC1 like intracellular cholesterol transporter 1 n=1 Tax=Salarias fasciatus TaxID=181472 RepID=A0A672JPY8_SALFA
HSSLRHAVCVTPLFSTQVLSEAQHEAGYCSFYEECGRNPLINGSLITPIVPCYDHSRARRLTGNHYKRLKEVCRFSSELTYSKFNNTYACCSVQQLQSLETSLTLSKAVLVRCPSCSENFAHLHCINTCSPDQSQVVNVTKAVVAFNSCKNVKIPATGGYAIATMCGRYGASLCTAQRWYDFQGDSSNGLAPLDLDFKLIKEGESSEPIPDGVIPYNGKALGCNETTTSGGQACSCQDCVESCPSVPNPPPPDAPFTIQGADGVLVICIIIFCVLMLFFVIYLVVSYCKNGKKKEKGEGKLKDQKSDVTERIIRPEEVTCIDRNSLAAQDFLSLLFRRWGTLMVLLASAVVVAALAAGLISLELTTDPVELWSAPNSRAREEKNFHDTHFGPFYRTNQLILTAPGRKGHIYDSLLISFFSKDLNRTATLADVCYAPLNPINSTLTDSSLFLSNLLCSSPLSFKDITDLGLSCMADYGAPVFPFLAVGGYNNEDYTDAEALIMTFSLNNYARDNPKFKVALQWETEYLKVVQDYQKNPKANFTFAYMAERSLEDEINRTTAEDIPIFMISYAVIFVYIVVALGEYSSCSRILVDSKFLVGLGGILVVGCSVLSSMGFYSWVGIPSSLVILQVVPFLVLAVGADNIFILVLEYQRDVRRPGEKREEQIGRVLGSVAPSMLLCSLSESVCFFLGALSTMPAVRSFALYAALAVLMDFILQMTAFVALLSLDARRQDNNRCELVCCVKVSKERPRKPNEGLLLPLMRKYYAPFLLHTFTRIIVMVVFIFMFCASIFLMLNVKVGLDQELAMPQGSYMLEYFKYLNKYFEVGVPVYFVTKKGYNFSTVAGMNGICSSVGCDQFSMTQKIQYAANYPDRSYVGIPSNSWVDDFVDWLNPASRCCRIYSFGENKGKFCPASESSFLCLTKCMATPPDGVLRPDEAEFKRFLPDFLGNRPDLQCPKGGLGAYDTAVVRDENGDIIASRFMAYHTPLINSQEYTAALKMSRELAYNITMISERRSARLHPSRVTNVFYEQYLTIVSEGLFNISMCLLPTFVVCCLLLGLDLRSGLLNLLTIIMITVDTVGVMTLWSIDYNAVALINLVTAVGISVEFVSHITRSFALSTKPTHVERAKEATANMGSAVFAGVAMTNLPGILVLAFAKAQLIQIFFFRLNLVITLLGMAHGLIFLPVLLSYFGSLIILCVEAPQWHWVR